ncbi:MAG: hypothetical protein V1850_00730, partial [Candidatus Bathyarchaeota archaeon]
SIPFFGEFERFEKGSKTHPLLGLLYHTDGFAERRYFEDKLVEGFVDKIKAGISIPNYPQFRDMDEMFLSGLTGILKTKDGYKVMEKISLMEARSTIPEVEVLRERAREISGSVKGFFKVKICVTGPYTLASLFAGRESQLFIDLGDIISQFIDSNVFDEKFGRVEIVAVDEPVFGLIDDPLLDYGHGGREDLLKAWEKIFHKIREKGVRSVIHLHNTLNELFWNVNSLDIIESHVNDSLYSSLKTREFLETSDKFLKASICITNFDTLIKNVETSHEVTGEAEINQRIADDWIDIRRGIVDPNLFIENTELISGRLERIVQRYGNRVAYAGPECGLGSFPTYDSAMECLRRVAYATKQLDGLT